jgi:tetratricopeptide (TPR) repeat protein
MRALIIILFGLFLGSSAWYGSAYLQVLDGRVKPVSNPKLSASLGDKAFETRNFALAKEYYSNYLSLYPEDLTYRGRLGSTLAFLGESEEAIKELEKLLAKNPNDFQGLAYLAIAYAAKGDSALAYSTGTRAIKEAPSSEARERLSAFLSRLAPSKEEVNESDLPETNPLNEFTKLIQGHHILGPKLVGVSLREEDLVIELKSTYKKVMVKV